MSSFFPHYIYWELSNYCNLRCKHCFAEATGSKSSIVNQFDIERKIDELHNLGKFSIRFGGGEPFLVPYLFDLITFCTKRNINVDITTNGTIFNEHINAKLQASGLRELTFSIDGLEQHHNYLRGENSFQKTVNSLSIALKQSQYSVSVAYTIHAQNYQAIEQFVAYIAELGINKIYFFRYCPNSSSEHLSLTSVQLQYISSIIQFLKAKYPDIIFVCEGSSFYSSSYEKEGCNFLRNIISIDYKGNIIVCAAINKIISNVFYQPIDIVFSQIESEQILMRKIPTECAHCSYNITCHGGCKSNSFYAGCAYDNKDIFCYTKKLNEK